MNDPFSSRRSTDPIKQSFDALVKDDLMWIFRELLAPITDDCIMVQKRGRYYLAGEKREE